MAEKSSSPLFEGISLYKKGDYTSALTFFISLPENSGIDNIELAYYIGLCYAKLERYDDALLYLEQVITSETQSPRVLQCRYLLAVIYALIGKKRLADFELNKLLETGYKPADVYASLAYVAWQQNEFEKCLDYYKINKHLSGVESMWDAIMDIAYASNSYITVVPIQDVLGLDNKYRINTPGSTGCWTMRIKESVFTQTLSTAMKRRAKRFDRD